MSRYDAPKPGDRYVTGFDAEGAFFSRDCAAPGSIIRTDDPTRMYSLQPDGMYVRDHRHPQWTRVGEAFYGRSSIEALIPLQEELNRAYDPDVIARNRAAFNALPWWRKAWLRWRWR